MKPRLYLVPNGHAYRLCEESVIDALKTEEIAVLGFQIIEAQKKQLMADAVGHDRFYHGRKVVDALQETLFRLEVQFPQLHEHVTNLLSLQSDLNN